MFLYIIENMNPNYNIILCFVEKIPIFFKKFVLYQNRICGFLLQVPTTPPTLLSTPCFIFFSSLFSKTLTFLTIPSHIIMIKTTRIQNSNQQSSLINPYPNCLIHPKSHIHFTPSTKFDLSSHIALFS